MPVLGRQQARIGAQDLLLQPGQPGPRFEAGLVDERAAALLVAGQGLSLAPAPVEREHELGPEALPQRMLIDQAPQPGDELTVPPAGQAGLAAQLDGFQPGLLELAGGHGHQWRARHVSQRRPAPQPQCLGQQRRGGPGPPVRQYLPPAVLQVVEPADVEVVAFHQELVAGRAGDEHAPLAVVQDPAHAHDVQADQLPGTAGRITRPEFVH